MPQTPIRQLSAPTTVPLLTNIITVISTFFLVTNYSCNAPHDHSNVFISL